MKKIKIKMLSIDPWLEKTYQFICEGKRDGGGITIKGRWAKRWGAMLFVRVLVWNQNGNDQLDI